MTSFSPGDVVVCVDTAPMPHNRPRHIAALRQLSPGAHYRVVGSAAVSGIILHGVRAADEPRYGWFPGRFRKIDKSDEGFAAWMRSLRPIPAKNKGKVEA